MRGDAGCPLHGRPQQFHRLRGPAQGLQRGAQIGHGAGLTRAQLERAPIGRRRVGESSASLAAKPQIVQRGEVFRLDFGGAFIGARRCGMIALGLQRQPQGEVRIGVAWIRQGRAAVRRRGVGEAPERLQRLAQADQIARIFRGDGRGPSGQCECALRAAVLQLQQSAAEERQRMSRRVVEDLPVKPAGGGKIARAVQRRRLVEQRVGGRAGNFSARHHCAGSTRGRALRRCQLVLRPRLCAGWRAAPAPRYPSSRGARFPRAV